MTRRKKILVVDDERAIVQLFRIVLEDAGFQVRGACDGYQALHMVTEEMPDLVLLDVMMPGMDGIEVCRQIRSQADSTNPCIIMFTADEQDSTRHSSLAAGANDLLAKEISILDLPRKINSYLTTQ